MEELGFVKGKIEELNVIAMAKAHKRLDKLSKPVASLGRLEEVAIQLAGIMNRTIPVITKKTHILMIGDHGVVEEGVSAYPGMVTTKMVRNFLNGGAAVNVLASQMDVDLITVDMGMVDTIEDLELLNYKVRAGTNNFIKGPAMSREEALKAIKAGMDIVDKLVEKGCSLISIGEMGIGNTTASSAIVAAIAGLPVEKVVGPGSGLKNEQLDNKIDIVKKALDINKPDSKDSLDILSKLGGFEIAGMTGCMLGAAKNRIPIVLDGFISGAAALIAWMIEPRTKKFMITSHLSKEPGHQQVYDLLKLKPLFDLEMSLGEGTAALLAVNIVESAVRLINEMTTFAEAGIEETLNKS